MTLGLKDRFSIVKGLLYLILGICCIYLIVTGRYLNYIAPRYELLLGISGVALILGGLATIIWAPSKYYKHNWKSIVPIIIPIMQGFNISFRLLLRLAFTSFLPIFNSSGTTP